MLKKELVVCTAFTDLMLFIQSLLALPPTPTTQVCDATQQLITKEQGRLCFHVTLLDFIPPLALCEKTKQQGKCFTFQFTFWGNTLIPYECYSCSLNYIVLHSSIDSENHFHLTLDLCFMAAAGEVEV